jgi:hypothetical protein
MTSSPPGPSRPWYILNLDRSVSWHEVQQFIQRLNAREGGPPYHAACPPRPNGRMRRVPARPPRTVLATLRHCWGSRGGMWSTLQARRIRWGNSSRTPGACMASTAMCGNGCRTSTGCILPGWWWILPGHHRARTGCIGAAVGIRMRTSVARRVAATPHPTRATRVSWDAV